MTERAPELIHHRADVRRLQIKNTAWTKAPANFAQDIAGLGYVFDQIDAKLERWISEQVMFFVGTAPDEGGHVNVSPKAPIQSFLVVDPHTVAYLDLLGSGVETIAHTRQNGRICIMFCAFDGRPRIVRLHGRAEALETGSPEFEELLARFDRTAIPGSDPGMRSLVRVAVRGMWPLVAAPGTRSSPRAGGPPWRPR